MIKKFKSFLVSLGIVSISTFPVYACGEHEYEHEISKAKAISQSEMGNVVIFIDFNDTNSFTGDKTKSSQVNTTYNEFSDTNNDGKSDNANISLKSYIYDLTRGKTSVNSYLYPQDNNGNYTSYKAPNSKSYYQTQSMTSKAEIDLIKNAFNSVSSQINLTDKQLDGDGDGNIDNVTFVFSGIPDNGNSMLRPHKYHITSGNPTVNGKKLYNYNIVAEGSLNINIYNGKQLGTVTHEFLHTLGYPDLYVGTNFSSKPVEDWDIMAKTSGTPRLPLVYSRNTYGNNNLKVQEITTSGTYTLKYSDSPNSQDVVAFKIPSKKYPNEYFMIEYRKNDTKYDKSLPGSGLIVYRINNNIDPSKGNYTVDGHHIYVYRPNETSENAGQGDIANAYLSSESGRTTFGTKKGASLTFDPNSIYFSNGVNSGIVISEVGSTNSDEITFKIEIPDESSTIQGDGSINNPFVIDEPSDMELLHYNLDKHFVLANDIDLKGIDFKPIGDINTNFTGTIDGKGYTIKNLSINSSENYVGFVGCLGEKGLIKNINFENIDVTSGGWYIGTVCGKSQGEIQNVRVFGNINSSSRMAVGGLVGNSGYYSSIVNCISKVDIVSTSNEKPLIGGIAGSVSDALVKNNYYSGKITANSTNRVGGVFGQNIISIPNDPKIDSIDNIWNITESNIDKGVSELNPTFNQTDKGAIGIEISNNIRLKKGEISDELIKYTSTPSQVIGNLTSLDTSIAKIEGNRAKAVSKGNTTIYYELYLGTNKVSESINVEVISDEPPVISGVTDSTIKAGEVANFDKLANITIIDDHDTNISISVTGEIQIPKAGTNEAYILTYKATDSDGNTTTATRNITVTNQIPVINGLDEVTLISGIGFDNLANVTATDLEDGVIQNIKVSGDYNEKVAGKYVLTYKATDSDGNVTISTRNVNVLYDTEETTNSDIEYVIKPKNETELNNIIEEIKKYDEKAEVVNIVEEKDFKIYKIKLVKKNLRTNEIYIELKVSNSINTEIDLPGATKPEEPTVPSEPEDPNKPEEPIIPDVVLTDIKGHWAEGFINDFVSKGYIGGYDDNTFRPNNSITRAEFVKIVNRTFGFTEKATEGFKDVAFNKWYYDDILIAKKAGYIDGYDDNTFRPDNLITREEASKIIATVKGYKGDGILDFDDTSQISNWAKSYVDALCDNNIINGYDDNTFKPKNRITRAETVKMLNLSE